MTTHYPTTENDRMLMERAALLVAVRHEQDLPTDGYMVGELEACAPESLVYSGPVRVVFSGDVPPQGFDAVTLYAPTRALLAAYVANHWGDDETTGGWTSETIASIHPVSPEKIEYTAVFTIETSAEEAPALRGALVDGITALADRFRGEAEIHPERMVG